MRHESGASRAPKSDERARTARAAGARAARYALVGRLLWFATRLFSRVEVEGLDRLPAGPGVLCFNHLNWIDPLYLIGSLPTRPPIYFVGPQEEDMSRGVRNRLMRWSGVAIPFKPGRRGLVATMRGVEAAVGGGARIGVAGEGRIHAGESALLPLRDGPAHFALRLGIPIVPVAINGTSWLGFRRSVRIRVGEPIQSPAGTAASGSDDVGALTARTWSALYALVSDFPEQPRPGRFGVWLTELFNDWQGPRPPDSPRR